MDNTQNKPLSERAEKEVWNRVYGKKGNDMIKEAIAYLDSGATGNLHKKSKTDPSEKPLTLDLGELKNRTKPQNNTAYTPINTPIFSEPEDGLYPPEYEFCEPDEKEGNIKERPQKEEFYPDDTYNEIPEDNMISGGTKAGDIPEIPPSYNDFIDEELEKRFPEEFKTLEDGRHLDEVPVLYTPDDEAQVLSGLYEPAAEVFARPSRPGKNPCFDIANPREIRELQELAQGEIDDFFYYRILARRAPNKRASAILSNIAETERSHARELSTAYFLLTGKRLDMTRPSVSPVVLLYRLALRERYADERRDAERFARQARETRDTCLRELYLRISREENEIAVKLRDLLRQAL